MRVALYLRRSTDAHLQPESLNVQEERLREYATRNNLHIVEIFADSASGVSVRGRKDFQRLLEVVRRGAPFEAVLVRDVTRWGRFQNVDESAYWEVFMLLHNVKVIYTEEVFAETPRPYDALVKAIRRVVAAEFSREKSRLVQAAHVSATKKGFRATGEAPYGMRAIVVTRDGRYVRTLKKGERKENSSYRMRLAPANNRAARAIRDIFCWYARDGLTLAAIARRLNEQNVPTSRRKKWLPDTVAMALENPAYGGICRVRFKPSPNFSEETTIEFRRAWQGVVSDEEFAAAEERLRKRRRLTRLDDRLREALHFWEWNGDVEAAAWERIKNAFPNGAVPKEVVVDLAPNVTASVEELAGSFPPVEMTERGFLLRNVYELGVRYSFPHRHQGRLAWEFPVSRGDPEDATLFVGLSPPPDIRPVEMFLMLTRRLRCLGKTYRPEIVRSHLAKQNRVTWSQAAKRIEHFLYSGPRADAMLIEAMKGLTYVNTAALARLLGWPEVRAYQAFARIRNRGVEVPTLVWHAKRHVKWSCDRCRDTRTVTIRAASKNKTGLCKKCYDVTRSAERRFFFSCRDCGRDRHLSHRPQPEEYRFSRPEDALCRSCAARQNVTRAQRESKRRALMLHRAYKVMASEIFNALRQKSDPHIELVDGVARLLSYAKPDGTRRFARMRIASIDVAARIVNGNRKARAHLGRMIAKDASTWNATRVRDLTTISVDELLSRC